MFKKNVTIGCRKVFVGSFILLTALAGAAKLFAAAPGAKLFPDNLPPLEWKQFAAAQFLKGYSEADAIYDKAG